MFHIGILIYLIFSPNHLRTRQRPADFIRRPVIVVLEAGYILKSYLAQSIGIMKQLNTFEGS